MFGRGERDESPNYSLIHRPEFLPNLPKSDSIWGDFDILNTRETSQATLTRVEQLIDETGLMGGIYIGIRQVYSPEEYKLPLKVFDTDPNQLTLPLDDMVTAISGPLRYSEAIASGYILETAVIAHDILDRRLEVIKSSTNLAFEEMVKKLGGQKRFIPLGLLTIHDYIARMAHYRKVRSDLEEWEMSEDKDEDLAKIIGLGIVPLAKAFRKDGYKIGENFTQMIDKVYIGNTVLFIPFAGVLGGHPQTKEDWQMVGLGLYTGVRLFRIIESKFSDSNTAVHTDIKLGDS